MDLDELLDNIEDIYDDELGNYVYMDNFNVPIGGIVKYFDMEGVKKGFGVLVSMNNNYIYLKNISNGKIYTITKKKFIFYYKDQDNGKLNGRSMRKFLDKYRHLLE